MASRFSNIIALLALLTFIGNAAARNIFLTIQGSRQGALFTDPLTIKGAPTNSVQIQTFNFAAQVTITGTTGAAGKPTYGSVNVARNVDVSSPLIMQSLVTGEALPAVTLTTMSMNAAGVLAVELVYKLTNARLTAVSHEVGTDALVENLSLYFQKLEIQYTSAGPPVRTTDMTVDTTTGAA